MSDRTLVVSATNLMARGFLVVPTDRTSREGAPVNGLYAVARAVTRALGFKVPTRAVAVVEAGGPSAAWPPLLAQQHAALPELLAALSLQVVESAGELHAVASYARAALARGDDVVVVGVDKRYAQLVADRLWWYDANKDARYTPDIVEKRFGVPPAQVAEWLALVGDEDALAGVPGIGAKGATALLTEHGSVAAALAVADTLKGRVGNVLRAERAAIEGAVAAARLDAARPLPVPLEALEYRLPSAGPLNALYERLGFSELLVSDAPELHAVIAESPEALAPWLSRGLLAVHPLLEDPAPSREAITGVALAAGDGEAVYVPVASAAWPALAAWLMDTAAPKLVHDGVATTVALRRMGLDLRGVTADSRSASHLTQPSNWATHDLPLVAKQVLGRALPEEDAVRGVGAKRQRWDALPPARAALAAGLYADAAARCWAALSPGVDAAQLAEYLDLADTLVRMELTGIPLDRAALARAEAAFVEMEASLGAEIHALAGHPFNINSTKQLGEVLFQELALPVASHTKTGWSTSTEALEKIEHAHPIVPRVIRWRLVRRLRDSWVTALAKTVDDDGRVRSRFHLARSFTGHLVNTNPDLGRVPGRTPEMAMIRRAFVAPPGHLLMSVDFNQLGLHVLAHLTGDPALIEPLTRRDDMHRLTAAAVLEKRPEEVTLDERQLGKVVNFATFAGQGASALALQLGVSAQEAKQLIERFDRRYARVRAFQDEQLELAKTRGYLVTIAGRRWPIGGLESLDPMLRSYAERLARRATHEGSVSDVSRRALLLADRALRREGLATVPVHQILDEVLFLVPEAELAAAARVASEAMRSAFAPLAVPLVVGVEAGPNWADLEPV